MFSLLGELGHFLLIWIAVTCSVAAVHYGWRKATRQSRDDFLKLTITNSVAAILCLVLLAALFVYDQFQFSYIASHSNQDLPLFFKIAAVWGGHEGSMLFWVFTLAVWSGVIALFSRYTNVGRDYINDVLWVMAGLTGAFAWFTLFASNPYLYSEQLVTQGRDLNPMLQDVGLIFHPPLLYLGYIGFSTVLAFALAALMQKEIKPDWEKACLPWAYSAWAFLTIGILVGSWWAYNELGWGGWWFWDPVENASLLPWLTGTALLHALISKRRNQQLVVWCFALALVTFSLSILGTFIVRSGVLTSVHAFAVDPSKGIALLLILAVVLGSSFILLLSRSEQLVSQPITSLLSRSYLSLLAVGILVVATFTVFLGTFYPMVHELLGMGSVSVGAPYFNTLFLPLSLIGLIAIGIVPWLKWQKGVNRKWVEILVSAVISMVVGGAVYLLQVEYWQLEVLIVWCLSVWVIFGHAWLAVRTRCFSPMVTAHVAIAVCVTATMMNSHHSFELSKKFVPNEIVELGDWQAEYLSTDWIIGKNYTAERALIRFTHQDGQSFTSKPEKRYYPVRVMNMSEPSITTFWHGDYYVTLAGKVDTHAYAVKIQYKAYIPWIWLSGLLLAFAGMQALWMNRGFQSKHSRTRIELSSKLQRMREYGTN
ncbi:heme lyase CcmF/NrfE family subunit [Vibrio maerlii]|uniref:heme lyase CcmF/NrfE family subunit n=1 Tax=Vibrio maerlii TaxID=2231648 RepID=UPI000E3D1234|nr:heme lyase NrfEFG subunit NrfE [Vibrio maerlii]